ncbi:MAG: hypothetical protein WA003_04720, partial [Desulfuromonadaceae bacterium]
MTPSLLKEKTTILYCHLFSKPGKSTYIIVLGLTLALALFSSARAVDDVATYPLLPSGYTSIKVFDNQRRFVGRILPEQRYWTPLD